jgi:hypothetical protein
MKKGEKHAGLAQQINGFGPAFLHMQRGGKMPSKA